MQNTEQMWFGDEGAVNSHSTSVFVCGEDVHMVLSKDRFAFLAQTPDDWCDEMEDKYKGKEEILRYDFRTPELSRLRNHSTNGTSEPKWMGSNSINQTPFSVCFNPKARTLDVSIPAYMLILEEPKHHVPKLVTLVQPATGV